MSRNGTGTYVLPAGNPVVTGTVITSTWANTTMSDIATALTGSIASDGQTVVTGNIQMGNNRITGMADGVALADAATLGQTRNANIISGNINGAVIGNVDPKDGTFTNLAATVSAIVPNINVPTDSSTKAANTAFVQSAINNEVKVLSFNGRTGVVTLNSADVTNALGYVPPTPTGSGASGSWGISVTGTASNVTGVVAPANGGTGLSAVGAAGNILTSNGSAWVSALPTGVPQGLISLWSGAIGNIPAGWALCDGGNGTPNLVDRFIVCAGSAYGVGATGGTANAVVVAHTHSATVNDPGHAHLVDRAAFFNQGNPLAASQGGNNLGINNSTSPAATGISVSVNSAGQDGTNANLPPYYALAYIMKL